MAEIKAVYRRVFQIKPYETETVELSVTDAFLGADLPDAPHEDRFRAITAVTGMLHAALAVIGDRVVLDRMQQAPASEDAPQAPVAAKPEQIPADQSPW